MFSFRRLALVLALGLPAAHIALAQAPSASESSSNPTPQQDQAQKPAAPNQGALTVQGRIRARREARRAAAIRDVYSHLYELDLGMGFARFVPGNGLVAGTRLQRVNFYSWNVGLTRYYNQRLGVTVDSRGYYGSAFVGINSASNSSIFKPAISTYMFMGGPTYRFYMQPKYSVAVRAMGGYAKGNFNGDTNGFPSTAFGMWPDGNTFAASTSIIGAYNVSPAISLHLAPEYLFTGFGSTVQYSRGFTTGFTFRFGKQ